MPPTPPPAPPPVKPKSNKQHAQAVARQILKEPLEIFKSAGQQLSGSSEKQASVASQTPDASQKHQGKDLQAVSPKQARHMQAFRQELADIQIGSLMEAREKDRARAREEEMYKKQQEEQKKNAALETPVAKIKRGIMGGVGKMMGVHKKQRSAELVKTPSN